MNISSSSHLLLAGKLALITGAGSGIGRAISLAYAQAGARVILTDQSLAHCEEALAEAQSVRAECVSFALNVTDENAAAQLAERLERDVGNLDILVNNAGIMIREGVDSPNVHSNVRRTMEVNFFGTFNLIQAFIPSLRRSRGCIINIASVAALSGSRNAVSYSASKGAIKMLTQSMTADLAEDGIRVNAIAPGVTHTAMTEVTRQDSKRLAGFLSRIPARRVGQPEEIASVAVFLASDMASYVNGVLLPVDGGFQAV
jgi:meso-butanediol dehydrogenase / (S,S)-butanediol dehydrogenase / diacetyl reductase